MKTLIANISEDLHSLKEVAKLAFSTTPDSSLEEWLSFDEMVKMIHEERGVAIKAVSEEGEVLGMTYAQQESPINGKEGREKWVIIIAAVKPSATGGGIGSALLTELEKQVKLQGAVKMFTYTNKDDEKVVNFYRKNGYEDVGWIRDYQYGRDNSAVFLLKYL